MLCDGELYFNEIAMKTPGNDQITLVNAQEMGQETAKKVIL